MTLRKLLFALVPLLVVYGAVETALLASGWPKATASFEHNQPFWVTDPDLKEKPFSHREEGSSFDVSTNSDGLRTESQPLDKKDDAWRVLALGCSTTFGWGVQDSEAYPARLESHAHMEGLGNLEVVNGGQPGYTSFQGVWLWSKLLRSYQPDLVLIGYVVQDARKAAYSDRSQAILQRDHRYFKDNVLYRSRVYLALRSLLGSIQIQAKERGSGESGIYRVPPPDFAANLRQLVSGVQEVGAVPVLFGYPLERSGYTTEHRRILKAASETLSIPHFDPQDQMEKASRTGTYYFSRDRGHANAEGNDLIARWVLEFLVAEGLAGASNG
jgi:lysophospholipase L1-like esterase